MTGLRELGHEVIQLTHARVRNELAAMQTRADIRYVKDGPMQIARYRLRLNWPLAALGSWLLNRKARKMCRRQMSVSCILHRQFRRRCRILE